MAVGGGNMIIGKLYMVTSAPTVLTCRSIFNDDAGRLGNHVGTLQNNDIVLFLGELNEALSWLKILTSDGIVGYVSNYNCHIWDLVEIV